MLKVCVIGGGPSGLMAAYTASLVGHQVELFEKNKQLGKNCNLQDMDVVTLQTVVQRMNFSSILCIMKNFYIVLSHNSLIWI